jgi:hypothetical protein
MPDVAELGRKVKAKYPGVYDDLDDGDLGRRVKAKYPGAYDDFTDAPAAQPAAEGPGFFQRLGGNISTGIAQAGQAFRENENALLDIVSSAARGDFRPLRETAETAGRGALSALTFLSAGAPGVQRVRDEQAQQIARSRAEQAARRETIPDTGLRETFKRTARQGAEIESRAARDPSLSGRITRGVVSTGVRAIPEVAVGLATGGSLPAIAATAAIQSVGQPETLPLNVGLSVTPIPAGQAFRAGVNQIRKTFGKGAAQIIEAEAAPAVVAQLRREIGEAPAPQLLREGLPPAPSVDPLPTVFSKLGTDNVDQIGAMIANANRRFGKKRTPEQIQSSMADYKALQQLTPDEQRALSQVLPERTVSPVGEFPQGGYSREVRDIPASEPDPQLDANLRQLESFFQGEGRALQSAEDAAIMGDIGPGAFGGQIAQPARVNPADLITAPPGGRITAETGPPALESAPAISAPAPSVRAASASVTGPSVTAPLDALSISVSQAAQSVPKPVGRRILDELAAIYHLPKSLLSSVDISAPFRQGSLLTLPPSQWGRASRAGVRMFQAFSTKQYDDITRQIAAHVDAPIADDAGLYLASKAQQGLGKAEEAFLSKYAGRIPLVKQSQQAYTTYLDSLRMDTFAKYKRVIDGQNLAPEQAQRAYTAAAEWINFATGRGSVGQRFDKVMDAANFFLFSPRYVASRFNVMNPAYYARNAGTPGGRAVLKQQMGELIQYAGVVAGTLALAKAAGADVGLNPQKADFLKIRFGSYRYDPLAGLQQVMRLVYRTAADLANRMRGQKTEGPDALNIGATFLRTKLAPAPAVFTDFVKGRTLGGDKPTVGGALVNLTTPIQWADFVEAYQKDGWGGVGMAAPGLIGVGVQRYDPGPVEAALGRNRPLLSELQRLNIRIAELQRKKDEKGNVEPDDQFKARVQQFGQNYTSYGLRLIQHPRFQIASDDVKTRALKRLNEKAKGLTHKDFAFPELELDPGLILDSVEK